MDSQLKILLQKSKTIIQNGNGVAKDRGQKLEERPLQRNNNITQPKPINYAEINKILLSVPTETEEDPIEPEQLNYILNRQQPSGTVFPFNKNQIL